MYGWTFPVSPRAADIIVFCVQTQLLASLTPEQEQEKKQLELEIATIEKQLEEKTALIKNVKEEITALHARKKRYQICCVRVGPLTA